ncbi:putative transcription factor interactor and regulator CCHC(Zn) family [Helianthus annuus]|uniref:Transcription factor interactor and regulator CCHC(Zn) family n=1 Tax=Helianthus annuus TaxID=4232 RepID=A0A9K3IEY7_HELAN|nr:putative transcription factor interactor and regulator CCHC(Zn) family [Helianthus annuus]KAJ0547038.1 putative transcription factor interactor and regulator CCHC(Zn) family [Helianthus annuus]KAJ0897987.1 putative transcription factor interactor and regulator CCHC(Zn) family [Helianthus annuus]KAJ0901729.1 putative transcription factor interactor and regulator CCHC(Zn) family [Helianthus annuus]
MVATNDPCFEYGEIGHLNRNCPTYLKELKTKRDARQTSGTILKIHIDLNVISSNTWVLDTGCGTHFAIRCKSSKEINITRKETMF